MLSHRYIAEAPDLALSIYWAHLPEPRRVPFPMHKDDLDGIIRWRRRFVENEVAYDLLIAEAGCRSVMAGRKRSQLICGGAGIGKTNLVRILCHEAKIKCVIIEPRSYASLYHGLWIHREAALLALDDNDRLAKDAEMVNLVKQWTNPTGIVRYESVPLLKNAAKDTPDPNIPAPEFRVKPGCIWLANPDYTDEDNITPALRPHWDALVSRNLNPRLIRTANQQDVFDYTLDLMVRRYMLRRLGLTLDDSNVVLAFFLDNAEYLYEVTPRQAFNLANARRRLRQDRVLSDETWRTEAATYLKPRPVRRLDRPLGLRIIAPYERPTVTLPPGWRYPRSPAGGVTP
jgi:hypothetical protein